MTATITKRRRRNVGLQEIGGRVVLHLDRPHVCAFQLRIIRQLLHIPVPELARRADVSPSTIYNYESQRTLMPTQRTLLKIAKPLGLRVVLKRIA